VSEQCLQGARGTPARSRAVALRGALGIAIAVLAGCATELGSDHTEAMPTRHYRPGESIADAQVCACEECVERACCDADEEPTASTTELGLSVPTCGGCYRRVWTVRGGRSCAESAPAECCEHG